MPLIDFTKLSYFALKLSLIGLGDWGTVLAGVLTPEVLESVEGAESFPGLKIIIRLGRDDFIKIPTYQKLNLISFLFSCLGSGAFFTAEGL